jgi:hypothetical protein
VTAPPVDVLDPLAPDIAPLPPLPPVPTPVPPDPPPPAGAEPPDPTSCFGGMSVLGDEQACAAKTVRADQKNEAVLFMLFVL